MLLLELVAPGSGPLVVSNNAGRLIFQDFKASCRILRWVAMIVVMCIVAVEGLATERDGSEADPTRQILFDVPAQPLESALEKYSVTSGWQVIYNGSLEDGRRSSDLLTLRLTLPCASCSQGRA